MAFTVASEIPDPSRSRLPKPEPAVMSEVAAARPDAARLSVVHDPLAAQPAPASPITDPSPSGHGSHERSRAPLVR